MAVAQKYERSPAKRQSTTALREYLDYLRDPTHEDHDGVTLLPGQNYNCGGTSEDHLVAAIERLYDNYIRIKDENGINKRSHDRWDEVIYNLGEGCHHTPEERATIERMIITEICPDAPARATWHIDPVNGYDDLHIVFSSKRPNGKLTLERTQKRMIDRLIDLDQMIADLLNNSKDKPKKRKSHIETAMETGKRKSKEIAQANDKPTPEPLPVQIARLAEQDGLDEVEAHHLPGLLERLLIRIKEIREEVILYFSSRTTLVAKTKAPDGDPIRRAKINTIHIRDFLNRVLEAQIDIRIARERKLTPATPATPVKGTRTSATKADKLRTYLEASLGRITVNSATFTELTNATKGMFKKDGTIKASILKTLPDDQRQAFIDLAKAKAQNLSQD